MPTTSLSFLCMPTLWPFPFVSLSSDLCCTKPVTVDTLLNGPSFSVSPPHFRRHAECIAMSVHDNPNLNCTVPFFPLRCPENSNLSTSQTQFLIALTPQKGFKTRKYRVLQNGPDKGNHVYHERECLFPFQFTGPDFWSIKYHNQPTEVT